jgi:hypothetical protein
LAVARGDERFKRLALSLDGGADGWYRAVGADGAIVRMRIARGAGGEVFRGAAAVGATLVA